MTTRTTDRTVSTWNGEVTLTFRVAGSRDSFPAKVLALDPVLDEATRTRRVTAPCSVNLMALAA